MTTRQAVLQLDDFFLGAAFQTSPDFDLDQMLEPPDDPPTAPKPVPKPQPAPTPKSPHKPQATPYPMPNLSFADYLKIHCGNRAAATYWYERNQVYY